MPKNSRPKPLEEIALFKSRDVRARSEMATRDPFTKHKSLQKHHKPERLELADALRRNAEEAAQQNAEIKVEIVKEVTRDPTQEYIVVVRNVARTLGYSLEELRKRCNKTWVTYDHARLAIQDKKKPQQQPKLKAKLRSKDGRHVR